MPADRSEATPTSLVERLAREVVEAHLAYPYGLGRRVEVALQAALDEAAEVVREIDPSDYAIVRAIAAIEALKA